MIKPKFIGITSWDDVNKTFSSNNPWEPLAFVEIPYKVISYPPTYMFTLGSGYYSAPTTSIYNQQYISGIDVFRQDIENNRLVINIDHYIATPLRESFGIFKEPPEIWHSLQLNDDRLAYIDQKWQFHVRDILEGKIRF